MMLGRRTGYMCTVAGTCAVVVAITWSIIDQVAPLPAPPEEEQG